MDRMSNYFAELSKCDASGAFVIAIPEAFAIAHFVRNLMSAG
jgi:hypothetical protein